jgi:hypothetical protein
VAEDVPFQLAREQVLRGLSRAYAAATLGRHRGDVQAAARAAQLDVPAFQALLR